MSSEYEEKRQAGELRRQCEHPRLKAALGCGEDSIALVNKEAG